MKNMKRAQRRHHYYRLKNTRKFHFGIFLPESERGKVANTPTPCSCFLCGNPRHHFNEKTVQEQKADYEE